MSNQSHLSQAIDCVYQTLEIAISSKRILEHNKDASDNAMLSGSFFVVAEQLYANIEHQAQAAIAHLEELST